MEINSEKYNKPGFKKYTPQQEKLILYFQKKLNAVAKKYHKLTSKNKDESFILFREGLLRYMGYSLASLVMSIQDDNSKKIFFKESSDIFTFHFQEGIKAICEYINDEHEKQQYVKKEV